MVSTKKPPQVSRALVRKLLRRLLPTDSDQDAFCLDYFPEVYRRFGRGMDRLTKTNLLLECVQPTTVFSQAAKCCGQKRVDQELVEILPTTEISHGAEADDLRDQLDVLLLTRAQRQSGSQPTAELDAQILEIKRQQRQKPQLREGEIFKERYRLIEVIGKGGFAKVWQAFDLERKRFVAVKVLHPDQAEDRSRVERFYRGAKQLRDLRHPHIVRVLDGPAEEAGFHYFVMDFLGGGDLQRAVLDKGLCREQALLAVLQAGAALTYTHAQGLIHRDVKPQNILLSSEGIAFLSDFDLVWASDSTGGTRTGAMGTYIYAAPEALEDASRVDARADVYAMGMTLLFLLSSRPLPAYIVHNRLAFIAQLNVSSAVKELLQAATAFAPQERILTMAEFCTRVVTVFLATIPERVLKTQILPLVQLPITLSIAPAANIVISPDITMYKQSVPTNIDIKSKLHSSARITALIRTPSTTAKLTLPAGYEAIHLSESRLGRHLMFVFTGATFVVVILIMLLIGSAGGRAPHGTIAPNSGRIATPGKSSPISSEEN